MENFLIDLIFTICEILIVISYLFRNILLLRIVTVIGMSGYIIGGFLAGYNTPGMKAIILFSTLSIIINLIHSGKLIIDQFPVFLSDELKETYKMTFQNMTTNEFLKITRFSTIKKFQQGDTLTIENQPVTALSLIIQGTVKIIKNKVEISTIGPGFFIGEMSFLTGECATATVSVSDQPVETLQWSKDELYQLENSDFNLYIKLKHAIAVNLIKKLA